MTRPPPDPYIPGRIRAGARPSAPDCYGCLDLGTRTSRTGRRLMVCTVAGKAPRTLLRCPKMGEVTHDL